MWRHINKYHVRNLQHVAKYLQGEMEHILCRGNKVSYLRLQRYTVSYKRWEDQGKLEIPPPEFDWDYLCDESKMEEIKDNIMHRKRVGDIDKVREIWKLWKNENNDERKSKLLIVLNTAAAAIPNKSNPNSPIGEEDQAVTMETVGREREFDFKPRSVIDICEKLGLLQTQNLSHTCSHRAYYFLGDLARLEHALIQFTLDRVRKNGFLLISVPDIINPGIIEACGFPTSGKKTQVYSLDLGNPDNGRLCLAGTSEMPIAGFFMNQILHGQHLPQKVCAVSRCYRAETSDAVQERGIYRVHEFTKVEMFAVTRPAQSDEMLQKIIGIERDLFSELGLYFKVLDMPTQELGAPAYQKYDIETWMPALKFWGEISSASNCTDYQSRRLNIKYMTDKGDNLSHVHTINGTACAIPRLIMAIVENYQQNDGSVEIPKALQPYMNGKSKLERCDLEKRRRFLSKPIELHGKVY
ncbi:hypothetical protein FSP39_004889 [Pinctada imbricata]|uniref:serine--tRNA ligase n=1 Tax=Pinctada imbricata TaxID=66713 RepID=A0AA88YKT5_PINIB|nr:hypothetical protein FSP39_004889 [Pinctada imbricata]